MPPPTSDDEIASVSHITSRVQLDAALCSRVVVTGACAPLVGRSPLPALVIELTHADGTTMPPAVLVLEEPQMEALIAYVAVEGRAAIEKSRTIRSLS